MWLFPITAPVLQVMAQEKVRVDTFAAKDLLSRLAALPSYIDCDDPRLQSRDEWIRRGYGLDLHGQPLRWEQEYLRLSKVSSEAYSLAVDAISYAQELKQGSEWPWRRIPRDRIPDVADLARSIPVDSLWTIDASAETLFWVMFDASPKRGTNPWVLRDGVLRLVPVPRDPLAARYTAHRVDIPRRDLLVRLKRRGQAEKQSSGQ